MHLTTSPANGKARLQTNNDVKLARFTWQQIAQPNRQHLASRAANAYFGKLSG